MKLSSQVSLLETETEKRAQSATLPGESLFAVAYTPERYTSAGSGG
jgi:hypothetical protein